MSRQGQTLSAAMQHHQAGRLHEAEILYRQVLATEPANVDALHLLGVIAHQSGQHTQAVELIESARHQGAFHPALLGNLGSAYQALGQLSEAESCYRSALQVNPQHFPALYNLGNVLSAQKRLAEAVGCYRQALTLQPGNPGALINLGNALQLQGDLNEAESCFEQGLSAVAETAPEAAGALSNLGKVRAAQARLEAAVVDFRRAVGLQPNYADAHFGLGLSLLGLGQWEEGWREYEWRWRTVNFSHPDYAQNHAWDGGELNGRAVVLYFEQGLGDTLQFVRYAPLVKARGGHVVVHCQGPLVPLLRGVRGIDEFVGPGYTLPADYCAASLLSLPRLFGTTLDSVPADIPYLHADDVRRSRWRRWLEQHSGRKVAVCWQGSPLHADNSRRSTSPLSLVPLAQVPGVRLVSVQVGDDSNPQVDSADLGLLNPGLVPDPGGESFLDLAALLCEVELVITVDTAVAHLAGALGVPVWLALAYKPDWRWLLHREDTPWYSTARLFRQDHPGEWDPVFDRMAQALLEVRGQRSEVRGQ
jgi:tetratricopeptide (TPR) repeat protein